MLRYIRTFGDSWNWTWWNESKSKIVHSITPHNNSIAIYPTIFERHGFKVVEHNVPGSNFPTTAKFLKDVVSKTSLPDQQVGYNIIWFSSMLRNEIDILEYPTENYEDFIQVYNNKIIETLESMLGEFMALPHEQFWFFGGQETLPRQVFDKFLAQHPEIKNVKLIYEDTMTEILLDYNMPMYVASAGKDYPNPQDLIKKLRWKFCCFSEYVNEDWAPELVDEVYESIEEWNKYAWGWDIIKWPDQGHLGFAGGVLFADKILSMIEADES